MPTAGEVCGANPFRGVKASLPCNGLPGAIVSSQPQGSPCRAACDDFVIAGGARVLCSEDARAGFPQARCGCGRRAYLWRRHVVYRFLPVWFFPLCSRELTSPATGTDSCLNRLCVKFILSGARAGFRVQPIRTPSGATSRRAAPASARSAPTAGTSRTSIDRKSVV